MARPRTSDVEAVVEFDENNCTGYSVTEERLPNGEIRMVVTLTLLAGAVTLRGTKGFLARRFSAANVREPEVP